MLPSALLSYFQNSTGSLLRQSSGSLRFPFIVPGAMYGADLWDWDSYWTTCGLLELAHGLGDSALRDRVLEHGKGCLLNFFDHQAASGALPIMLRADNPDVFGCLCEGGPEVNQAKPILGQFALRVADELHSVDWIAPIFEGLLKFYAHWEAKYGSPMGLLVWGSDVAVGVDNDPTTYGRPDFSSANLLLNCLYLEDLKAAAVLADRLDRVADAQRLKARTDKISSLLQTVAWDSRDQFFYTLDVQCRDQRIERIPWAKPGMPMSWASLPLRFQVFTGFLPLWCGAATVEQAHALRDHALNADTFCAPCGIRTLSKREPMYSLAPSGNPINWLVPIWILANYFVWCGLRRYGFLDEAAAITQKTVRLLENDIAATGVIHEYYHPETGAPLNGAGFLSWNTLVLEMIRVDSAAARCSL